MIPSYPAIKPQTLIRQLLDQLGTGAVIEKAEHIAGSSYQLQRYTNPEEYAKAVSNPLTADLLTVGGTLPFSNIESNTQVDHDFTKLYGEQLFGELNTLAAKFNIESLSNPSNIELNTGDFEGSLDPGFRGLAPSAGTHVRVTHDGKTVERTVVSVLPSLAPSSFGSNVAADDGFAEAGINNPAQAAVAAFNLSASPGGQTLAVVDANAWSAWDKGTKVGGAYGEQYTLTALENTFGGSTTKFLVTSLSGKHDKAEVTFTWDGVDSHNSSDAVFGGLAVEISGAPTITAGDVFVFEITGIYETSFNDLLPAERSLAVTGTYTGAKNTTYYITVTQANASGDVTGAKVEIRDSAGIDDVTVVTLTNQVPFAIGSNGLNGVFDDLNLTGLLLGDVFTVDTIASARTGENKVLVLNGPAADTTGWLDTSPDLETVAFYKVYNGYISPEQTPPTLSYASTDAGLAIEAGLSIPEMGRDTGFQWVNVILDARSKLFVHYRARRLPAEPGEVLEITSNADIEEKLGKVDRDNPLAYAAFVGLAGAQDRPIYASKVTAETAAAYVEAYTQVMYRPELYILVPATSDDAIQKAVQGVINAASAPAVRLFKHSYFSIESPGYTTIAESSTVDETDLLATVETGDNGANRIVLQNAGVDLASYAIRPGHEVRINYSADAWGNETYTTAVIASIISSTELSLEEPIPAGVNATPVKIEIVAPPTPEFQTDAIVKFVSAYGSRRTPVVWSDNPRTNASSGEQPLPAYALAAYIGGLRSVMPVQMGLTDRDIPVVSSAPGMYARFSTAQLDTIAAAGTMIVTQDTPRGAPYVRHQLTTETDKGPLYYEDSISYNMDEVSFALNEIPAKYRGQYQASDVLVRQIRFEARNQLVPRTRAPLDNPLIGPQLADFRDLNVYIHPTLRSKIVLEATLVFFLPFNQMEIRLRGTIDQEEGEFTLLETTL